MHWRPHANLDTDSKAGEVWVQFEINANVENQSLDVYVVLKMGFSPEILD